MRLQIELTSRCISKCPACMLQRLPYWKSNVIDLDLDKIKPNISNAIMKASYLFLGGSVGEITYYPKFIEFLVFVYECNPNIVLSMITIAQISDIKFWDRFINICNKFNNKVMILIPLDGLSDTYSMYRINCSFETAFNNALYLIKHGLRVSWSFIKFPHNIHQLETCRKIAKLSGFYTFDEKDAWNFESDNYHTLNTSEYKIHNTTKLACSDSNKLMITCDGYLWPCCHIISVYYYRHMFINDLKISELSLYENQFENIFKSDKWKTSMTNILQSGVCNEKLCDMK